MTSRKLESSQTQKAAVVSLNNKSPNDMELSSLNTWSGDVSNGSCPITIKANSDASFIHVKGETGSRGGVKYTGLGAAGEEYCLVIAWDAPAELSITSQNKVYVMGGPKSVVEAIDWFEIEELLGNASSSASSYGVDATITYGTGDTALVAATIKFPY